MERRGVLKSWDDGKGFGFIQPEAGGEQLFVHISAMRGGRGGCGPGTCAMPS